MVGTVESGERVFKEKVNHVTGEREWEVTHQDYDIVQEIARSRFGDMILDYDRNDRYEAALITVIKEKKAKGEYVHVLDIGTGTGLLSLMAARAGADRVTALEVFAPMADCAQKIIDQSGYADFITVIAHRSTDLSHLGEKPNVIVAEVFDTELIGEGALRTFKEALEKLVQPGCRVIPARAKFYVQAAESPDFLRKFNDVPQIGMRREEERKVEMRVPLRRQCIIPVHEEVETREKKVTVIEDGSPLGSHCPGNCSVHDVQASLILPSSQFTPLSEPTVAFEFNFEDSQSILFDETAIARMEVTKSGRVDAFLAWWDLDMDGSDGGNTLTMAPDWKDSNSRWRDHWMQAIYYPPKRIGVERGQMVPLLGGHDEFSLWFAIDDGSLTSLDRPYCVCDFHARLSRTMIYRMNELMEDERLAAAIEQEVALHPWEVVVIGEGSMLGLHPSVREGANRVTILERTPWMRKILRKYIKHYQLNNVQVVADMADLPKPSLIVGEPFFLSSVLPWENLPFWYEVEKIRSIHRDKSIPVMPNRCSIRGIPMKFRDLHNTAGRVGTVNGFNLSKFDDLSEKARSAVDEIVEDYSLWEYVGEESEGWKDEESGRAGTELLHINLETSPNDDSLRNVKLIQVTGEMNGIAMWVDWQFGEYWMTTGRKRESSLVWSVGHKQGVYFIPSDQLKEKNIHVITQFTDGEVTFNFSPKPIGMEEKN
ncbi:hypothetical protein PENTCL1PPCAC_11732 [Pristionchus entomophagus]|uniref:Protein arginine N-methyltransferase n=1 Tax=Pristionchus entomophagus TaxID=358040 RepID=A0AAV5T3L1_9BILA|nr:hypothetical protein PENTCL1PPCAC_11732 [Pristionchus entomophagus]